MADEKTEETVEEVVEETEKVEETAENKAEDVEKEDTGIEKEARSLGWKSKDELKDDSKEWVDAAEYVRREPIFQKLRDMAGRNEILSSKMRRNEDNMGKMARNVNTIEDRMYKKALVDLKSERSAAITDGDAEKAHRVDEEIDKLRDDAVTQSGIDRRQELKVEADRAFNDFQGRNEWFDKDELLTGWAMEESRKIMERSPGILPDELFEQVEKGAAKFLAKKENPRRSAPSTVEGARTNVKKSTVELTADEKEMSEAFVNFGLDKDIYNKLIMESRKQT